MTDPPHIRRCTCGHLEVQHGRSRGGHLLAERGGGPCFTEGCGCTAFTWQARQDIETLSRAALTPADKKDAA